MEALDFDVGFTLNIRHSFDSSARQFRASKRLMHRSKIGWFRNWLSGVQLVEQRLGLFQIERVEAFKEPAVDRGDEIARCLHLLFG